MIFSQDRSTGSDMTNTPLELPAHLDLEKFISDQTHDLRSPFNQIVGFSKMLLNNLGPNYPLDMQREDLGIVYRNSQRALLLMNGLIDIARLNRHEKEVNLDKIAIDALLEQSLAYWKKSNSEPNLQVEYQIQAAASQLVVDELLFRQILSSLVLYVAQYVDPAVKIMLTIEDEPDWFVLTVASVGKKIQPTSQLNLSMQGYIGRALIELHQGEIRRAEETDEGASVQFTLPRA
jgi:signal transduction histidine kinase